MSYIYLLGGCIDNDSLTHTVSAGECLSWGKEKSHTNGRCHQDIRSLIRRRNSQYILTLCKLKLKNQARVYFVWVWWPEVQTLPWFSIAQGGNKRLRLGVAELGWASVMSNQHIRSPLNAPDRFLMENENCPSPGKYQAHDGKIAAGTHLNQFNSSSTS